MSDIVKKISSPDFNADRYVKEISQVCIGGLELMKHKTAILALSERTNLALKKNVYKNYMQFIETAREISHVEGDMYQVSRLLAEQRALLSGMGRAPLGTDTIPQEDAPEQKADADARRIAALSTIAEKVEGCITLTDVAGRELLHEGDMVELDLVTSAAIHRCHAFLLSDILVITTWISNRRGSAKYKYEAAYEVASLAVVNVRDLGNVKHAFKLLVFPDTRLFQCANQQAKEAWLTKLEEAKRAKQEKKSMEGQTSIDHPSQMSIDSSADGMQSGGGDWGISGGTESPETVLTPDWVLESPEDVDVATAQRHFEEALSLIRSANAFLESAPSTPTNLDIKTKMEGREKALTEALLTELSVSSDKSMQGGLRASRRAVKLLNQLGKTRQACDLYLKLCTTVLKSQTKRVKREFATTAYVRQLAVVFFSNLAVVATEFQHRAFGPDYPSCAAAFAVWASSEVAHFTANVIKQVFMPQTPLSTLAECVEVVVTMCQQLTEVGLDMRYQVEGQLAGGVTRAIGEARDRALEAGRARAAAPEHWRPAKFTKPQVHKLTQEMASLGLPPLKNYVTGDGWVELTAGTVAFMREVTALLEDGLKASSRPLERTLAQALRSLFDAHFAHAAAALKLDRLQPQRGLIMKNALFVLDHLLPRCSERFAEKTGHPCKLLDSLRPEYTPAFAP